MTISRHLTLCVIVFTLSCAKEPHGLPQPMIRDPHSFARHDEVAVTHLALDLLVDFDARQLRGSATLSLKNNTGATRLYLDSRDLNIQKVLLDNGAPSTFILGPVVPHLGQELSIEILPSTRSLTIHYTTSPEATALQWLEPAQTAGGKMPFLLTQSQSILARTWIPCQDHPGVRMTYEARIQTPPGMMAVMSAENQTSRSADGVYTFTMPQSIPSYLLALAVGDIEFRKISDRCGVYAEPSVVDTAAWEFADTEKMMLAAEELYGPYRWGRFDIIVLPPSFPFGGMENPRLTFVTPTLLAGDRSLTSVIAHELAHSWSGNLVTNASWNDFWLNEGFTVYVERRILEKLYGRDHAEMHALLGYQDLQKDLDLIGRESSDTRLLLSLEGRDPDDAVNDIAYEKGYFFLRTIEEALGRERWDLFLKEYFDTHAFHSMTTERFVEILRATLVDKSIEEHVKIDDWVYMPGLPGNCPKVISRAFSAVDHQIDLWKSGTPAGEISTDNWSTQEWLHFIRGLPQPMTLRQMKELDLAFRFSTSGNAEILHEWFLHVIRNKYQQAYPGLEWYMTHIGRRKLLKPLYTELAKTSEGASMAKRIYASARPGYHAVTVRTIDDILKWNEPTVQN